MDIREMKAGRELDELIQAKFFKSRFMRHADGCLESECVLDTGDINNCSIAEELHDEGKTKDDCAEWKMIEPKPYSTDISAAFEVMEKIKKTYWVTIETDRNGLYYCQFTQFDNVGEMSPFTSNLAEAICKAALLALEGDRYVLDWFSNRLHD